MREPGRLRDLGRAGRAAWDAAVRGALHDAAPARGGHPHLVPVAGADMPHVSGPDWTGLPARAVADGGRAGALAALDSDRSRQDEYVEWRTVRSRGHKIERVELTTELRDYWRVLAAYEPGRTLELVSEFARREVRPREVYGVPDPHALLPAERLDAFNVTTVAGPSPLNDGAAAICFMSHASNDLSSLVEIAAAAARPLVVHDTRTARIRLATAAEAIPHLGAAAVAGRSSDPVIVERLGQLSLEGRRIALADPVGVYIEGVEHARLRTPDGSVVPREWFAVSRGKQRLVLEVPSSAGLAVSDLVDIATEERVEYGGQIADLVQLRLFLRVSDPGAVRTKPKRVAKR